MGRSKNNPEGTPGTPGANENQDQAGQKGQENAPVNQKGQTDQQSSPPDSQGAPPAKNTESATAGGDGGSGKAKPLNGKIKNPEVANRTVYGATGKPVVFDDKGVAECDEADGLHFMNVPGYKAV
jgi:hypothetical protein